MLGWFWCMLGTSFGGSGYQKGEDLKILRKSRLESGEFSIRS
jgi:hypothetical protein